MECTCVRHTELPHATKLFTDLTYHFDKVRAFYPYSPHDPESYAAAAPESVRTVPLVAQRISG